ncbi:hypothetical protein ABPG74_021022 [Tetrahymena malaccensis]
MIALNKYRSIFYFIFQIIFIALVKPKDGGSTNPTVICQANQCADPSTNTCQVLDCTNFVGYNGSKQCTTQNDFSTYCCIPPSRNPNDMYCLTQSGTCKKFDSNAMKDTCVLPDIGECRTKNVNFPNSIIAVDISGICITQFPSKNPLRECEQPNTYCMSEDKLSCLSLNNNPSLIGINETQGICIQKLHQIIPPGQKISLQNGYCLDPIQNSVEQMLTPNYIGIDQSLNCVIFNRISSDNIKICVSGYCSDSKQCLKLSDISNQFTSRLDDANNNKCSSNNQPNSTECSKEKNSCFDAASSQCQSILNNNTQFSGVDMNGNCVQLDVFIPSKYNTDIYLSIIYFFNKDLFKCGLPFCILSSSGMKSCTNLSGSSSTMGIDANGYCVPSGPAAVKCANVPQICQDQTTKSCVFLSSNILDQRVGKELITGYCIPYKDPSNSTGNQIERCADNFCIYTQSSTSQQFCIQLGFSVQKVQYVGIEQNTQNCLTLNQTTKIANSLSCADKFYCVNQLDSNKCQNVNDLPSSSMLVGKNQITHLCIPIDTQTAIYCGNGYCMLGDICKKLSRKYAGREDQTQQCINAYTQSQFGVVQCFTELYCIYGQNQKRKCIDLDYDNVGASLDPNNYQHCVTQNDSAVSCFRGEYCVNPDPSGNKNCLKSSDLMCTDQNKFCIQKSSNQCYACNFNQCLSSTSPSQCIPMNNIFCQDINGLCQYNLSKMCAVCQKGLCLQSDKTCISPEGGNQEYSCFYQFRQDRPCLSKDINYPINNQMSCRTQSNLCEILPNQQINCLVCPKIYSEPSDLQCYDEDQRIQIYLDYLKKNNIKPDYDDSLMIFGLRLLYKPLDCYNNQSCSQTKCPEGCATCSSQNTCTSCITGYFLYQKSGQTAVQCVKCLSQFQIYSDPISLQYGLPQTSQLKCQECELNYGLDQLNLDQRVCQLDFILFQNTIIPNQKSDIAFNYQVISGQTQSIPTDQIGRIQSQFQLISYDYKSSDCDQLMEDCVKIIDNCKIGSFIQSSTQQIQLLNPWISYQNNISTQQICVMCNEGYFSTSSQQNCYPSFSNGMCMSSNYDQSNNIQCLQCYHQYVFNFPTQQCSNQFCQNQLQNCLQCYYYLDQTTPLGQIYQCTQCQQGYMPTVYGCTQCPQGCQSCYQGNKQYNFTNYLIYSMPQISLQERLNYQQNQKYRDFCMTCQEGYQFDYKNYICNKLQCGQFCSTCVNNQSKPLCLNCDLQGIQNQIKDILYFISMLYYQLPSIPDMNQMISLNQDRTDCILCPITCLACSRSNQLFSSQYDLYDAQCLSCKSSANAKFVNQGYEIRYDRQRMKCLYCKLEDNLCIYTKTRTIYMYCGSLKDEKGKGTKVQPINYNRLFEIDLDYLIVSDEYHSLQQAYVWYNELQLKELYVKVIINDSQCKESVPTKFSTKIRNYIKSLEIISLEITTDNISSNKIPTLQLTQVQPTQTSGFNQITISNLQISLNIDTKNQYYGFIMQNKNIISVNFTNVYFQRPNEDYSMNIRNILQIKISSLNNTLILNNVQFYGQYFYNSQIFQVIYQPNSSLNLDFDKVTLNKVHFEGSTFISKINQQNINTQISNLSLNQCTFELLSSFIDYSLMQKNFQSIFNANSVIIQQNLITNSSFLFAGNQFQSFIITSIQILNNQIIDQSKFYHFGVIISNIFEISSLISQGNTMQHYTIFQQPQLNIQESSIVSIFDKIDFIQNTYIFDFGSIKSSSAMIILMIQNSNNIVTISNVNIEQNNYVGDQKLYFSHFQFYKLNEINIQSVQMLQKIYAPLISVKYVNYAQFKNFQITQQQPSENCQNTLIEIKFIFFYLEFNTIQIINYNSLVNIIYIQFNYIDSSLIQPPDNPQYLFYGGKFIDFYLINSQMIYEQQIQNNFPIIIKSQSVNQIIFTNLNLINNYIKANNKYGGSGIFIDAMNSHITINNSNFTDNLGTHKGNGPLLTISDFLQISNSVFQNTIYQNVDIQTYQRTSIDIQGGFASIQAKNLKIFSCQFLNGKATQGGAIYLKPYFQANHLLKDVKFIENWSVSQEDISSQLGGALYIDLSLSQYSDIAIEGALFQNNFAGFQGGSIYIQLDYKKHVFILERVNFSENLSFQGSSIFSFQQNMRSSIFFQQVKFSYTYRSSSSKLNYITKQNNQNLQSSIANLAHFVLIGLTSIEFYQNIYNFNQKNLPNQQLDQLITQIADIVDFQSLYYIRNTFAVNDILGIYSQAISYKEIISFVSIQNILIENSKYLQNQIFPSQGSIKFRTNSIICFVAQQIFITNSTYMQNACQSCPNGNLLIESLQASIYYSNFQKNQVLNGGGIYFKPFQYSGQQKGSQLQIQYSNFTQNIAYNNGGSINIEESSALVQNCIFYKNNAQLNGGAILHNISNSQTYQKVLKKQVVLLNNLIVQNQASVAGAYYSVQGIFPQYFYSNNTIIQNQASIFGRDLVGYGAQIQIIINDIKIETTNFIYHHTTGKFQDSVIVLVVNQNGEVFKDEQKQINLNIQLNSMVYNQSYSFIQKYGIFNLTNLMNVYGQFNSEIELKLSSDIIQIPLYQNTSDPLQITDYSSNYNTFLKIKINNQCNIGYQLQKIQTILDYCSPCIEGYYNTQPNQHCIKCPNQAYYCKNQIILLKSGYWRENSTSSDILTCDQNKNSCLKNEPGINFENANQQCAEGNFSKSYIKIILKQNKGYIGPICDDCDIEKVYWGQRYQKTGNNLCQSCSSDFKYSILMFTAIIFYSLIFSIYITDSTINQFKQQVVDSYFILFKFYVVKKTNISSTIIKILINYLQVISIITTMNIPLPRIIGNFITIIGSPSQQSQKNLDCLYIQMTKYIELPFLYAKFVFSQIQLGFICLLFFGLYRIYCLFMKRRFHLNHFITGLILIYYQNFSGIVQQLLGSISCRQIGYKRYVLDYPQYECDQQHERYTLTILFPFLLLWAIVIPLLLLYFLTKNQFSLQKLKLLTLVGFIYEGYKQNKYYWEIIQIAKNILIAFFLKYYGSFNPLMYILCAIAILVYSSLLQNFKPLTSQQLNNLNITSSNYSVLIIMLGLIAQEQQSVIVSIFCLLLMLALNLRLALQVIDIILKEYMIKIKLFLYPIILNLFEKLHMKVDRTSFNVITKSHVIKLWKKLTYKVHLLNKKASKSSNFMNLEFKQNLFLAEIQDYLKQIQIIRQNKLNQLHQTLLNSNQIHNTQVKRGFKQN